MITNKEFIAHGYHCVSNAGGIEIMFTRGQDGVYYRWVYGQDEPPEIFEAEIQYDQDGEPYFMHQYEDSKQVYYLNEFMRATGNLF